MKLEYLLDISNNSVLNENKREVMSESPFYVYTCGQFYAKAKYYTRRDELPNYLLIVTTAGCGEMRTNGESVLLNCGSAVLIDCNIYHEYNTYANGEWDFYFVHFGSKYINLYKDFLLKKLTPIYLRNFDKVCQSMEMLNRLSFNNDKVSFLCESNLISDILTEMVQSINEAIKEKPSQIERLKDFISSNFRQDLHIEDFVEYTHLSKFYLIREFEKYVGVTPYKFLHLCRIKCATALLKTSDMSIANIAYEIGYNDPTVFIRQFKSIYKISPGKFRENLIKS